MITIVVFFVTLEVTVTFLAFFNEFKILASRKPPAWAPLQAVGFGLLGVGRRREKRSTTRCFATG